MKKWIIRGVLAVVVLIVLAVVGVWLYLDTYVMGTVRNSAEQALGVETQLSNMHVGLMRGRVTMAGLEVENPGGFKTPHFLSIKNGRVEAPVRALLQQKVVLPELVLGNIDLNLEKSKDSANYEVILENLQKYQAAQPKVDPEEAKNGKRYLIKEMVLRDVNVHADVQAWGEGPTRIDVFFPEIRLKDVGTDSDKGVLLSQLSSQVTQAVLAAVWKKAASELPSIIASSLKRGLEGLPDVLNLGALNVEVIGKVTTQVFGTAGKLGEKAGDVLNKAAGTTEDLEEKASDVVHEAGKAIEGVGGKIGEGLGDLLGGKKKKEKETKDK